MATELDIPRVPGLPRRAVPGMGIVDSHCHLIMSRLSGQLPGVLSRATEHGVTHMMCIGMALDDAADLTKVVDTYPDTVLGFALGVHPHNAHECYERFGGNKTAIARHIVSLVEQAGPRCLAIGECGLDTFRNLSPFEEQQVVMEAHLMAAAATSRPVVIHTRGCDDDTVAMIAKYYGPGAVSATPDSDAPPAAKTARPVGIMHCFSGTPTIATRCLALGFHLSFSGAVTLPKMYDPADRDAVLGLVPRDRFLVETDAPFITPDTFRKKAKCCEPFMVSRTVEAVAEGMGITAQQAAALSTANFKALFNMEDGPASP